MRQDMERFAARQQAAANSSNTSSSRTPQQVRQQSVGGFDGGRLVCVFVLTNGVQDIASMPYFNTILYRGAVVGVRGPEYTAIQH